LNEESGNKNPKIGIKNTIKAMRIDLETIKSWQKEAGLKYSKPLNFKHKILKK
jgi:hypothetical protein